MLFGLGLPEWLTIVGLIGGLLLTFRVMARASLKYEAARRRREQQSSLSTERKREHEAGDTSRIRND
jgi:hypothetical protein